MSAASGLTVPDSTFLSARSDGSQVVRMRGEEGMGTARAACAANAARKASSRALGGSTLRATT